MKKLLFLILSIFCLGLINFSSAGSYTYSSSANDARSISSNGSILYIYVPIPLINNTVSTNSLSGLSSISCTITNLVKSSYIEILSGVYSIYYTRDNSGNSYQNYKNFTVSNNNLVFTLDNIEAVSYSGFPFYFTLKLNTSGGQGVVERVSFDYSCTISGDNIINQADLNSSSSSCSPEGSCTVNDKLSDNLLYSGSVSLNNSSYTNIFNYGNNGAGTYCVKLTSSNAQTLTFGFANGGTTAPSNLYTLYNDQYGNRVCLYGNKSYFNAKLNSSSNTVSYEVYKLTDLLSDSIPCSELSGSSCDYTDYILLSDVTENYCTNRYSDLINESDITSGYCETEFGLIDPENCPASGGTGDVNWSSFFVNSHQIQGANNVYLWLPDFLNWDYTYIDSGSTLEIDVENVGDPEYIENVLSIQTYRPTDDEFALSFVGGLTLILPYCIVVLFIIFIVKIIRRIFK